MYFPLLSTLVVKTKMDIHVDVLVQFYSWFRFYIPLLWGMVICDNEFETGKIKFKPRIKLNHNIDPIGVVSLLRVRECISFPLCRGPL